jgi:hypothetical protein
MIDVRNLESGTKAQIAEWLESIGHKPLPGSWPRSRFVEIAVGQRERLALARKAKVVHALRYAGKAPEPDLEIPSTSGKFIEGWQYTVHTYEVWFGWSTVSVHGTGPYAKRGDRGAQRGTALYSTRKLALEAMRDEVSLRFGAHLLHIDKQIEQEPK